MKKNLNLRLFIVAIMVIGGLFCLVSCASKSGHRNDIKVDSSLMKVKVVNEQGIMQVRRVDTMFNKGDILRDGVDNWAIIEVSK